MHALPSTARMYRALVDRDRSSDGLFFAGIRTTGIFCRPGCGARKPLKKNVEFFASPTDAMRAGYRPCRRCRPLELAGATPDWAQRLFGLVESSGGERITSRDLERAEIHPARAARWFKERFGMTFQAYQRARRVAAALPSLRSGSSVGAVADESGFESESGFRAAFTELFGMSPTHAADDASVLRAQRIATPIGPMLAVAGEEGLLLLEFVDRRSLATQITTLRRRANAPIVPGDNAHLRRAAAELERYFAGDLRPFELDLVARGTPFQESVWRALQRIPCGETRSYADVAREIGQPSAVRAVANANGMNRIAIVIPCHRVIGSDGSPTGYAGGIWRKTWLLDHERGQKRLQPRVS